jgi:phage tail-like protein
MSDANLIPLHVFRFHISIKRADSGEVCGGAFAECSGLEATMEPKVIKSGGANYGAAQRPGPVSFATVVLKRGITQSHDLFDWFQKVAAGEYSYRQSAQIAVHNADAETMITWQLARCMPVKFKAADLNAKGNEIGIEELHLAHEGLFLST